MKRMSMIVVVSLLIGAFSFTALVAGIQIGYALASADGRVVVK